MAFITAVRLQSARCLFNQTELERCQLQGWGSVCSLLFPVYSINHHSPWPRRLSLCLKLTFLQPSAAS